MRAPPQPHVLTASGGLQGRARRGQDPRADFDRASAAGSACGDVRCAGRPALPAPPYAARPCERPAAELPSRDPHEPRRILTPHGPLSSASSASLAITTTTTTTTTTPRPRSRRRGRSPRARTWH